MASHLPYPLTQAGKEDAALIARELSKQVYIDRIITSPLLRAKQTAECFAGKYDLPMEEEPRMAEQNLGMYSGMGYDQVKKEKDYEQVISKRWNWHPPKGGESYKMIAERVSAFFAELDKSFVNQKADSENQNILIVTHAVTLRLIRAVLEQSLPAYPEKFPNNGEIWKIPYKGLGHKHTIESLLLGNSQSFVHNP